jgi:putative ABC transport system substrate-binding protein
VSGALAAPLAVNAQPAERAYRIGCLMIGPQEGGDVFREFVEGLRDLGYVEGRNLLLERRRTEGSLEQVRALAEDLVRLKVDVIVTGATARSARPSRRRARSRS